MRPRASLIESRQCALRFRRPSRRYTLETTATLILWLFPAAQRSNPSVAELAERVDAFTRTTAVPLKLDRFVDLFNWLRVPDQHIHELAAPGEESKQWHGGVWKRQRVWVSVLEASPEIRERYSESIGTLLKQTAGTSLFAQSGLPNDRGLFAEAADRFFRIVLPAPRSDEELSGLLLRMFPSQQEVDRFFDIPPELFDRIVTLAAPAEDAEAWKAPVESMLEAFCLLGARVQGLGLSEKLLVRSQRVPVQQSPFYRLPRAGDQLIEAIRWQEGTTEAAQNWKAVASECRVELENIVKHLETRGVNLDVVYAMDVIEKSLSRMEIISGVLVSPPGPAKRVTAERLMREVIRGRIGDRSVRMLLHNSFRLLARKIVEWAGKTGEHYIANNREEYYQMWKAALGGGLLTVGTAAIKLMVTHQGLPLFVEGFLAGLNYAVSFVLLQNFHLALATKQPSMTGAALAKIVHNCRDAERSDELVSYAARIVRTQLAAALGNIIAVGAGCLAFSALWKFLFHSPYLSQEVAEYAVHSLNPFRTGTIFYAILTGIILWLSSLAGGWIENWAVYHQLPVAIAEHRLGAKFKPETLARLSNSFSKNIAGWGGSITLGFMLGMTPVIGAFLGLPFDVRHVTLSTGTLALGIGSLGFATVGGWALFWAAIGIAVIFVLNLGVSFYLALRLAMRAQDIAPGDHLAIWRTFLRRLRECPRDFFFPPAAPREPEAEPV
jgi:site-specific recombinase